MGKNISTQVVSFRLTHADVDSLKRIAKDRDLRVNALLMKMVSRRIREIRTKEGW